MGVTWNHVSSVSAPLIGGFAWHFFGYQVIFVMGAVIALISLGVSQLIQPDQTVASA
jgi:MFS family permease